MRNTFKNYFNGVNTGCDFDSGISFPSFESIAQAFHIPYLHCGSNQLLPQSVDWLFNQDGPAILEIEQQYEGVLSPCVISKLKPDGTSEPAFLQDMSPFIDRDEYNNLMISD